MKRLFVTLTVALLWGSVSGAGHVNLDTLYRTLDAAIDSADFFLQRKQNRLDSLKRRYQTALSDMDRFTAATKVYEEYVPFDNDSAIAYQYVCIDLAETMGRQDLKASATAELAYQLAISGFYSEAKMHYDEIPEQYMKGDLLNTSLSGIHYLYGELGYYSHDPRLSRIFLQRADSIRGGLLAQMDTTSLSWITLRTMMLNNQDRAHEALPYSDQWLQLCQPGTRGYAIMAFYRSEIYKKLGDTEMQRYWLVQAALVDIRNAIMDQGALWSLANLLILEDDDLERAYRYIGFSWKCLSQFSTHMRSWLVAPVVDRINAKYKERLQTANERLRWTLTLISLLLAGLLLLLAYVMRKRRQLARARNELKSANEELKGANTLLSEANGQLSETNEQLRRAIIHLNDSNRVKDEYIGKFLSVCSEYIDKLDNYRIKVNRKLKANQYQDLMRMTESEQLKVDELKELLDNFDAVFMHLFPTFIDEFNALLRPEERMVPSGKSLLNTDLRIFALIRLGIDESSRIAEFLHYSPNSIYAYRARIKNKAAGNRDEFESLVKEIGLSTSPDLPLRSGGGAHGG